MRVRGDHGSCQLRTPARTPRIGIRLEETLAGGETVRILLVQRLPLFAVPLLERHVGQPQAAVVSCVFALRQQPICLYAEVLHLLGVLVRYALAALVISFGIRLGPPVLQVALRIELTPLVV